MRILILMLCLTAAPLLADPGVMCSGQKWGHAHCIRPQHFVYDTCNAMRVFSRRHGLDTGFFARLIWQESRFDANALSHADARGIAQFIPSTAAQRGLKDPYNPADGLEHSAQYLAEMVKRYGNEGMAAIGYNGGERRARGFLEGKGLAPETVKYVPIITGLSAEDWRDNPPTDHDMRLSADQPFLSACYALAKNRRVTPLKPPARPGAAPALPTIQPWGVQVTFGPSKKAARSALRRKTASCRRSTRGEVAAFVYVPHRVSSRKGFFFARYGRSNRAAAQKLCDRMRREGCPCRVVRNKE